MKRRSLKHRMLMVLSASILMIFIILFSAFNLIMQSFIRKEAVKELRDSLTQVQRVVQVEFPGLDKLTNNRPVLSDLTARLEEAFKGRLLLAQQNMAITDKDFNLLYFNPSWSSKEVQEKQLQKLLRQLSLKNPTKNKPIRLILNNKSYYAAYLPLKALGKEQAKIVFITDTTDMTNFSRSINRVLFMAIGLSALAALVLAYLWTSRTVNAIKKLGSFAKAIGQGDFTKRNMSFKDQELQDLSLDMNHMAQRLMDQDNQQKAFFQNISHEFKTPLMSIQGYAEGIKYSIVADNERACDIILEECGRLSEMVNELLLISRLDNKSEAFEMAAYDLKCLLSDTLERIYGLALAQNKEIVLSLPPAPISIWADDEKLSRAVLNLATNCIRHARKRVDIGLSISNTETIIVLADDGDGFDAEDLPHLFERFYKGKNGKTGLGLAIAKSIIEAHHGTLTAANTGEGACFTIKLPKK
ncbi:MAG: HAMP domain-containing histidine kinase [Clostridia bacterium]|nr:HAMP domain-containing histidine kinase [Clostridia bacterium]